MQIYSLHVEGSKLASVEFRVPLSCDLMRSLVPEFERRQQEDSNGNASFVRPTCKWTPKSAVRAGKQPLEINNARSAPFQLDVDNLHHHHMPVSWWISRSSSLSSEHRNAWVVTLILEQFLKEEEWASQLKRETFGERMAAASMASILDEKAPPRKRCKLLRAAGSKFCLLSSPLYSVLPSNPFPFLVLV